MKRRTVQRTEQVSYRDLMLSAEKLVAMRIVEIGLHPMPSAELAIEASLSKKVVMALGELLKHLPVETPYMPGFGKAPRDDDA